ncbi:methylation domain-containing protein [Thermoclostridium stercorarium subsp. leptospartum DSM 9219]|uniref:Methylation domain-containing protein n=1 Tax=Thermoclostridium stercorarium subsp. leptospartum DSM 9219 TaxID=1346611 RepID=A0A1B1YK51_THEST|nr:type II secretion system protein [Thermoclostridium stercorarium]ANX01158.1 methylation domain-containing protein [Thermoclostridium stercorarium subsp. leptospartum DSM 9219]
MMKKLLKQNKGFSLVELLVAILIMAVIAATAIMLFGGVLNSSKTRADAETAENIKRAILTYMNLTNDTDLSCLGVDENNPDDLIRKLSCIIKIEESGEISFAIPSNAVFKEEDLSAGDKKADGTDIPGEYGPFLDGSKDMKPQAPDKVGWKINVDVKTQVVTVEAVKEEEKVGVTINTD